MSTNGAADETPELQVSPSPAPVDVAGPVPTGQDPEAGVAKPRSGDVAFAVAVALAAWLVPGAGHILTGRVFRGLLFGVVILGMFAGGLALDGKLYVPLPGDALTALAAVGGAGAGAAYFLLLWNEGGEGDLQAEFYEYGTTFALAAGLLNLLVVLDAFDVATGRRP